MRLAALAIVVAACGGCSKDSASSSTGSGAAAPAPESGDSPRDALLAAWKKAGLDVGAFAAAQTKVGQDCQTGRVAKLDVLVCVFVKPEDAKSSEEPGLGWVGATTGASQAHGSLLIAVADKAKADPHGKTINQLMKLAPN